MARTRRTKAEIAEAKLRAAEGLNEAENGQTDDIFFIGSVLPVKRVETGMWSLDRAFMGYKGEIGVPVTSMELYGPTGAGKSSLAYSLAAIIASKMGKKIVLADLEGFNPDTFKDILRGAGYKGGVYIANGKTPDIVLDDLIRRLKQDDVAAGILDSVAAISPIAELNSGVGEANMGRRAKVVTTEQRKLVNLQREDYKLAIHINHELPTLGMFTYNDTPGGKGIHYLSAVRIRMRSKKLFSDGSFVIEGKVAKNRWGFKDRMFWAFFLMGYGLHPAMSVVWECAETKLLYVKKGESVLRWRNTGEEIPTMMTFAKAARAGDLEMFQPFFDAIKTKEPKVENLLQDVEPEEEAEDETEE